jgi:hypothetical protein
MFLRNVITNYVRNVVLSLNVPKQLSLRTVLVAQSVNRSLRRRGSGTDVMTLKTVSPKQLAEILAFCYLKTSSFSKNWFRTLVYQENAYPVYLTLFVS